MPILVEPERGVAVELTALMPPGSQTVSTLAAMRAWLERHPDEYLVLLGPGVSHDEARVTCADLRVGYPTVSVVLLVATVDTETLAAAVRAGARDVIGIDDANAVTGAIRTAFDLHTALRGPSGARQMGRVVTVFSPKGGVGKTTVAVNLSLALSQGGARKVCLVDLDLAFGDDAITLQLFPTQTIEQAVGAESTLDLPTLEGMLTRHEDSLMVLAAPNNPDVRERVTPALLTKVLKTLREGFDLVVVDTAPALDEQALSVLDEADEVVVVATLDVPTLKNVKVALETLNALAIAPARRHLLLNMADPAVGLEPAKVEEILDMSAEVVIGNSTEVASATNSGVPIVSANPAHPVSQSFAHLASILTGDNQVVAGLADAEHVAAPQPKKAPRRLFGLGRGATA